MFTYPTDDHGNPALCHECGGLCCALYLAHDENGEYIGAGWLPEYIELWLERFVASGALRAEVRVSDSSTAGSVTQTAYVAGAPGVEPLHDPRMSHLPTPEGAAYRAALEGWIDIRKCQFCHPETGCLLPAGYRAPICHEYTCELWELGR
ncbi:MAG: hypothetical protein ACYC77_04110 [Coriobacteriia bacterium]